MSSLVLIVKAEIVRIASGEPTENLATHTARIGGIELHKILSAFRCIEPTIVRMLAAALNKEQDEEWDFPSRASRIEAVKAERESCALLCEAAGSPALAESIRKRTFKELG